MESTPLPFTSLSNLFLSYPRRRILDVVMRNLTEPLRYQFLVEMSECELLVSLSKYWAAFVDPFVHMTVYFFKACEENMGRMARFMKRHGYRRVYMPPEGALERRELRGSAARQATLQRSFEEIEAAFAAQWQELARRGVIRSRMDLCLLRTAQVLGVMRRKDDPTMGVLKNLMDDIVIPIMRETPSLAWEHLLRPERQLVGLSAGASAEEVADRAIGSLLAASEAMDEDDKITGDRTPPHPAGVEIPTMDNPKKTRQRSDLHLARLVPPPKRRKLCERVLEDDDPEYQYVFSQAPHRISIV